MSTKNASVVSSPSTLLQSIRSWVYDSLIVGMTKTWYREVLTRLPMDAMVLDVGIGTATSLIENRDLIHSKRLKVIGVDYDQHYVLSAAEGVKKHCLDSSVEIVHASIHDYTSNGRLFDAIYFSGSFMIIPDQALALRHCVSMLKPSATQRAEGCIYFTQTFERDWWVGRHVTPWVKFALKKLLTIDFGEVTFEQDFLKVLRDADVAVVKMVVMHATLMRSQVLVIAQPKTRSV